MTQDELDKKALEMAKANHIWLNAFQCVRPTEEFKRDLGGQILEILAEKQNLMPSGTGPIGELTPMLYLSINKS